MKKFRIPIYDLKIWFTQDRKQMNKWLKDQTDDDGNKVGDNRAEYCEGLTATFDGHDKMYIGVFDGKLSTLVHELTHAGIFICATVGIEIELNNQEPYAYIVTYLFEKLQKEFKNGNSGEAGFNKASKEK